MASIARRLAASEPTVRKYLRAEDLSPWPPVRAHRGSVIDKYVPTVDRWPAGDGETWYKRRHTPRACGRGSVTSAGRRCPCPRPRGGSPEPADGPRPSRGAGFLDLSWHPGECQAGSGEADVYWRGVPARMHHLVLDFPYPDIGPSQLMPGENAECACLALRNLFEWLGGVPSRIVYDDTAGVGRRRRLSGIRLTKLFQAFQTHYDFGSTFRGPVLRA